MADTIWWTMAWWLTLHIRELTVNNDVICNIPGRIPLSCVVQKYALESRGKCSHLFPLPGRLWSLWDDAQPVCCSTHVPMWGSHIQACAWVLASSCLPNNLCIQEKSVSPRPITRPIFFNPLSSDALLFSWLQTVDFTPAICWIASLCDCNFKLSSKNF